MCAGQGLRTVIQAELIRVQPEVKGQTNPVIQVALKSTVHPQSSAYEGEGHTQVNPGGKPSSRRTIPMSPPGLQGSVNYFQQDIFFKTLFITHTSNLSQLEGVQVATITTDSAKFPQSIGLLESSFPSFYSIYISIVCDKVKYNLLCL